VVTIIMIMIMMLWVPILLLCCTFTFTTALTFYIVSRIPVQCSVTGIRRCDVTYRATWILGFGRSPVYRNKKIKHDDSENRYKELKMAVLIAVTQIGASPTFYLRTQTEMLFTILFLYFEIWTMRFQILGVTYFCFFLIQVCYLILREI